MSVVLTLLLVNAVLGAWDTLWYHEYKARLPQRLATTRTELKLHVVRDLVYVGLYGVLAWWTPSGWWVALIAVGLVVEIVATLADFVVEDRDRPAIGGMAPGERVLHTLMAIVYGAMLSRLLPVLYSAAAKPTGWTRHAAPGAMSWLCVIVAAGIAATGTRDALALAGFGIRDEPVGLNGVPGTEPLKRFVFKVFTVRYLVRARAQAPSSDTIR